MALHGEYAVLNHPLEEVLAWVPPKHYLPLSNTSGYRGVDKLKDDQWQARIRNEGTLIYLGIFATGEEAAQAYDRAALNLRGEKAHLNFPVEDDGDV